MRVVIDTNVLVSAAVVGREPEAVILLVVSNPEIEWIVSTEILTEYQELLSRPRLKLSEEQKQRWFDVLNAATTTINVEVEVDFPRDRKDAKFLACAVAANATFLISGDRDLTDVQRWGNTTIISVSLFKRLINNLI
ncbi:putative toxin-antitoxin system toxin component, PIN family [[Phormidium ambiguum] IAM M-71]|uniref:Putative toxin-antitoxin system toxin component, PIN family n=1 Tax=[Phormidium ambiguum] IAM M-71 TaxID=454136 RepID=A0A1U7I665_9CYAN|nr:putative toxin-antitoxin system toxin component, PIN family [Phormidium ambiguum]OKH31782.1 putative toxin-antitoxin system toxin component, PIN family [Phormidium ambiguum IAM M-71]